MLSTTVSIAGKRARASCSTGEAHSRTATYRFGSNVSGAAMPPRHPEQDAGVGLRPWMIDRVARLRPDGRGSPVIQAAAPAAASFLKKITPLDGFGDHGIGFGNHVRSTGDQYAAAGRALAHELKLGHHAYGPQRILHALLRELVTQRLAHGRQFVRGRVA